jgi:CRISPR/Cas system-associated exonuclease Cas4 (RecB family)
VESTVTPQTDCQEAVGTGAAVEDAAAVEMQALEQYLRCPRRYYYSQVLGLRGAAGQGFSHYHQALRQTLARLEEAGADEDVGLRVLAEEWRAPHEAHPHEALFWERARRVVRAQARMAATQAPGGVSRHDAEYVVPLRAGAVRVRIDRLDQAPGTPPVAIRFHGGAPADGHRREHRTALYQAALDRAHGQGRVAHHYLLSGAVDTATAQARTLESRLREADEALAGIARAEFSARRSEECPGCPFWLICPAG